MSERQRANNRHLIATPSYRALLPVADRRDTMRLTWQMLRRRPWVLTATALSFVIAGLAGVVAPFAVGRLVDGVRGEAEPMTVYGWAGLIAAAALIGAVATAAATAFLARAAAPALAEVREDVLDRILHLDVQRVEAAGAGDVLSRTSDDVREVTESFDEALPLLLTSALAIVFTTFALGSMDWRLGLAGLGALPAYLMAMRWYLPRSAPYYRRERTARGERAEALVTGLQGSVTLRALGRERLALGQVQHTSRGALEITVGVFALLTRFWGRMNLSELIGLLLVLGTGYALVEADAATVGEATAAALYFHRLFNPIGAVLMVFDRIQSAGASLARLAGVVLMPRTKTEAAARHVPPAAVTMHGVHHAYDEGRDVLHGVDLDVPAGRRLALVGASGAGKTTVAAIVAGQLQASKGTVTLNGQPASPESLRRRVTLVTQEVHVFGGTVRDNLTLAAPEAGEDALWTALRQVGADVWVRALPHGLDTRIGSGARALGASRAQHLALARVMLRDPAVVVLDEATAEAGSAGARELDIATEAALVGRTAVVVAHRLTQAARADSIAVMHDGRLVEQGTHDELVAAGGRYAELWAAWSDNASR